MSMKARTQGMNKSQPWTAWFSAKVRKVSEPTMEFVISRFSFMPALPSPLNSQKWMR